MMPLVCFIACHANPADHFSVFAADLKSKGFSVELYASGPALAKLPGAQPFLTEEGVAQEIARKCAKAALVITDVAHPFDIAMQEALKAEAPLVVRAAYYDNPEDFVPGGYSETAAKVARVADKTLFANANLADAPESPEKEIGLGYYPLEQAAAVAKLRKEKGAEIRARLFESSGLTDRGQKLLVYAGGNNEEYFSKAWPAFLSFLKETDDFVVFLQQHPGAKKENRDGLAIAAGAPRLFLSSLSTNEVQAAADAMLYYQTSMAAQFVLAEIPTIQVGHEIYRDILTKNGLCETAVNREEFISALKRIGEGTSADPEEIQQNLGIRADWGDRLVECVLGGGYETVDRNLRAARIGPFLGQTPTLQAGA